MKYKPVSGRDGSLQAYVETSYVKLVELFGEPNSGGDNYKVSTEWILEDEEGKVVTIYEYKTTNSYDSGAMSVEAFRALPSFNWHIGAEGALEATRLKHFIESK